MNIILGANLSANGRVLQEENPGHQAPQEAVNFLMRKALEAGNLVIGRKTFELINHYPGGFSALLPGLELVVLSRARQETDGVSFASSVIEAVGLLSGKGFSRIAVGGGTQVYNAFLDSGMVNEIYFNIIPAVIGGGGVLGTGETLFARFSLNSHHLLSDGVVQLHYIKKD